MKPTYESSKNEIALLCLSVLSIFIFYVVLIRNGHDWGGDFALYLQHAQNLIQGKPYKDTGYIINPSVPWLSPQSYPPVFPVLLTPVLKIFGLDIYKIKIYLITIFCISLVVLYRISLNKIENQSSRILIILFSGFSPWFIDIKDNILSEFPFLLFLFSFILMTEKYLHLENSNTKTKIVHGITIGLFAYLAYGCRSIGIILIPAFIFSMLFYRRRIDTGLIIAVLIFSLLYILQNQFLHTDASYNNIIANEESHRTTNPFLSVQTFLVRLKTNSFYYMETLSRHWDNEFSIILRLLTLILTAILTIFGLYKLIKIWNTSEIVFLSYVGVLLIVPFLQGNRYLLPIMPLHLMYIFKGIEVTNLSLGKLPHAIKSGFISILFTITYIGAYTALDFSEYNYGVKTEQAKDIFQYIKMNIEDNAVIVFKKPRPLALFTNRRSFSYNDDIAPDKLWENINALGANYLLTTNSKNLTDSNNYLAMVKKYQDSILLKYANKDFVLYIIRK